MKLTSPISRPSSAIAIISRLHPVVVRHGYYAIHHRGIKINSSASSPSSTSKRKAVTPFNDTGFVPWQDLSTTEKAWRTTQQTFNFGLVIVGLVMTGGVGYFLYQEVFSPDSKTAYFNRAVNRIKKDPECIAILGDSKKIIAHGDATLNKWRRARPISATMNTDAQGNEHMIIQFHVEGPLNEGLVRMHLVKRVNHDEFEYKYLILDVKGHPKIYLENANAKSKSDGDTKKFKLFGVKWN